MYSQEKRIQKHLYYFSMQVTTERSNNKKRQRDRKRQKNRSRQRYRKRQIYRKKQRERERQQETERDREGQLEPKIRTERANTRSRRSKPGRFHFRYFILWHAPENTDEQKVYNCVAHRLPHCCNELALFNPYFDMVSPSRCPAEKEDFCIV